MKYYSTNFGFLIIVKTDPEDGLKRPKTCNVFVTDMLVKSIKEHARKTMREKIS